MNFSKSLAAIAALAFLASCGNDTLEKTSKVQTSTGVTTSEAKYKEQELTEAEAKKIAENTSTAVSEYSRKGITTYKSPAGDVDVAFEVVVDSTGIVKDVNAAVEKVEEHDQGSPMNISKFNDAIDKAIVGKKLSDIQSLDAVGGASLTTDAFKKFAADL